MPVLIKIDTSEVQAGFFNLLKANIWSPLIMDRTLVELGKNLVPAMRDALEEHRYRGILAESVEFTYDKATKTLTVGPNAKRGAYDAGDIFELGTQPIPGVPWANIKAWGLFRGLDLKQIRGAWLSIQEKGVKPHPWIDEFANSGTVNVALEAAGDKMGRDLAAEVFKGTDEV